MIGWAKKPGATTSKGQGGAEMNYITLTQEEKEILIQVLEEYISDLRIEISHTDDTGFREPLKARKETIGRIIDTLQLSSKAA
jgi:hypothetical protein